MEVWKDVLDYEGYYKVSNKGNVFSVERLDSRGYKCGGILLRQTCDQRGYPRVNLYKNGKMKNKTVHRLVAEAFIPNPNNYLEINHKDEVKGNNNVENLEWCTRKYNVNHGTGLKRSIQKRYKKVRAVNIKTGAVLTFSSTIEAVDKGYNSVNIGKACRGIYNTGGGHLYRGHRWSYI